MEKNQEEFQKILDKKTQEYSDSLSRFSDSSINEYINVLKNNNTRIKNGEKYVRIDTQGFSGEAKEIFDLMRQYEQDIKQIYLAYGKFLTHITDVSPEDMIGGKINRSINRANDCETESGDWAFASSTPVDGKNLYMARKPKDGMIIINDYTYILGGNHLHIEQDESGNSHVVLNNPNYIYRISPKKFKPVTTLIRDDNTKEPRFRFTEEWISEDDIDITDKSQVPEVTEITDVTEVIQNYQIFCDVNKEGIAKEIRSLYPPKDTKISEQERKEILGRIIERVKQYVESEKLRYINGESGINVSPLFTKMIEKSGLAPDTMDEGIHTITKPVISEVAQKDCVVNEKENAMNIGEKNKRYDILEQDVTQNKE